MDVVYLCRTGANEELRYSLRSLANIEHDKVWVFGGRPAWYQGRHVPVPQDGPKQLNAKRNLYAACTHPGVSDTFLLMNDDFFVLEPAEVRLFDRGPVREVIADYEQRYPDSSYTANMRKTLELLEQIGYRDPLSFELHVPMPVHKAVMLAALDLIFEQGHMPLNHRTIHGALAGDPSATIDDVKVYGPGDIVRGPWLSCSDGTFRHVRPLLEAAFPDPCRWECVEAAVVVVKEGVMYTCPKRVERKGVLVAYAGEVMSEAEALRRGLLAPATEAAAVAPEPAPEVPAPADEAPPASEMTVRALKALLDERGVEYGKHARRADLLRLAGL